MIYAKGLRSLLVPVLLIFFFLIAGCRDKPQAVPDFRLPVLGDEKQEVVLSEVLKGHPVLLVFWATWCPACLSEIPTLNEWNDKYQAAGLKIFGINFREDRAAVTEFAKRQAVRYPILLDRDGRVAGQFGLEGLPAAVVLDRHGKIIYFGFSLPHNMDEWLQKMKS